MQHVYRNALDGLVKIARTEGLGGLYKGAPTSMFRSAVGTAITLTTYTILQEHIPRVLSTLVNTSWIDALCSLTASLCTTLAINPMDVVRTRLYNESGLNFFEAILSILRVEGPIGFLKGWSSAFIRLGPHMTITFTLLEQMKRLARQHALNSQDKQPSYLKTSFIYLPSLQLHSSTLELSISRGC